MKKKIAIYHNLPHGGGMKTIEEFSKRLSSRYILDLYTLDDQDVTSFKGSYIREKHIYRLDRLSIIKGGPFIRLQEDYNIFVKLFSLQKKIAEDIDKKRYDLVILSHDIYIQTPFLGRFLKSKTLYYCQEPWRIYYEYFLDPLNKRKMSFKKFFLQMSDRYRKFNDLTNAKRASKILVNSYSSMESVYRAYGVYASVCHLGVDFDVFRPLRKVKEDYLYSVGNLSIHKGHEFIIDSLALLRAQDRPRLFISTGGINLDRKNYLEQYASLKKVEIKIISRISEKDMVSLYNKAKIVICAAHLETLGLSVLEAMACETPVIAVREGGYRDMIVDGVNGLFVDRDERSLAKAVRLLLTDSSLYSRIARQSRKSIYPYWSWDAAADRLVGHIKDILG